MAASNQLTEFVGHALGRGVSRVDIKAALQRASWSSDQVDTALAGYADVDFPIPVPKPKAYLSAREAFQYLLLFSMLYISAYDVGSLVFQFINRAFPDAAVRSYEAYQRMETRWLLASLIVAFPVFLYLSTSNERSVRRDPVKRRSDVRRWLMYLTIFISASVLIGDFMALVYNTLGGELSIRFVLKAVTIATIAGTALSYYLADIRLDDTKPAVEGPGWARAVAAFAVTAVATIVIAGLFVVGSPAQERARRLDQRRVGELSEISRATTVFYERHNRLPSSIAELAKDGGIEVKERDPLGVGYGYRMTNPEAYELCSTFQRDSAEDGSQSSFWSHGPGRRCFTLKAKDAR